MIYAAVVMWRRAVTSKNLAFVAYYTKQNRYSFNALVGAVESAVDMAELPVYFPESEDELIGNLAQIINHHEIVVVGFSFFTTQLWLIRRTVNRLRERFGRRVICIAGGPHPTGDPMGTLSIGFDLVALGEGECTITDLLRVLRAEGSISEVKGIAFLDEAGAYQSTGRRPWLDIDALPPFAPKHERFGPIEITRGCPFACNYCQTSHILGTRPRHRSVDSIIRYVSILKDRGMMQFRCITPDAFSYGSPDGRELRVDMVERLLRSARETLGPGGRIYFGSFPSEVRPEHVTRETVDLVVRYADNDNLIIGAQSGSQRVLDLCRRGHTVDDVFRAVDLTMQAGLKPNVDFLFGLPGENSEDIYYSLNAMLALIDKGARIHAHTFMPLPQTGFASARGGRVHPDIRKMIKELGPGGAIYGDWGEQQKVAQRIATYFRTHDLGD